MTGTEGLYSSPRFRLVVAWFDFWIGVYYDRANRRIFIFPVPCLGLRIDLRPKLLTLMVKPYPTSKISAIKEIRAATGLGLKEAKDATEGVGLTLVPEVAKPLAKALRDFAEVEVRRV